MTEIEPMVTMWYQHHDKGQEFTVVAVDDLNELVEIQLFDGNLEEVSLDSWYEMNLEIIEEPENWSGPVDYSEKDDLGDEISDTDMEDWNDPLEEITFKQEEITTAMLDDNDDWGEGMQQEERFKGEL
ncbi:MAG: hypothetical protein BMS9Abin26_0158 [Gammaproteobacteria bacterium]|nr:MAG: hypothetical protein BMS9Abin26_0158 [Gammaproteobacteria bacterium]